MMSRYSFLFFIAISFTVLSGCGQGNVLKTEKVEGIVTLDNSPLEGATVKFFVAPGSEGDPGFGTTDATGKFILQTTHGAVDAGTTQGDYIVTISKSERVPTGRKEMMSSSEDEEPTLQDVMTNKETLPAKYTTTKDSPFKVTVEKKKLNSFNFDLESK